MTRVERTGPVSDGAPSADIDDIDDVDGFDAFVAEFGHDLWQALIPLVGPDRARDAAADGLSYAWSHWERVKVMANRRGYVYVAARRYALARPAAPLVLPAPPASQLPDFEPALLDALRELSEMQRTVVYLVEGCGWRLIDAADLLGISVSTVRNHLARAMDRLRARLAPPPDQEGER